MTFVGKILVLLNLVMSVFFMTFAIIVYNARIDLAKEVTNRNDTISKLQTQVRGLETQVHDQSQKITTMQTEAEQNQTQFTQTSDQLRGQVAKLTDELKRARLEATKAEQDLRIATQEQEERRGESGQLRDETNKLLSRNNELVTQKADLEDRLAQAVNELELLNNRNQQVTDQFKRLEMWVATKHGGLMPTDAELEFAEENPPPPNVEGIVTRVKDSGRFVQISLGADDGIRKGQVLEVWRTSPRPKYLGQVKIFSTEATTAVAQPLNTVSGLIQENDHVGPTIFTNSSGR